MERPEEVISPSSEGTSNKEIEESLSSAASVESTAPVEGTEGIISKADASTTPLATPAEAVVEDADTTDESEAVAGELLLLQDDNDMGEALLGLLESDYTSTHDRELMYSQRWEGGSNSSDEDLEDIAGDEEEAETNPYEALVEEEDFTDFGDYTIHRYEGVVEEVDASIPTEASQLEVRISVAPLSQDKVDAIKRAMSGIQLKPRNSRGAEVLADSLLSIRPRLGDEMQTRSTMEGR